MATICRFFLSRELQICVVRTFFNDENAQRPPQFNKSPRKVEKKTKNKTQRGSGEETKSAKFWRSVAVSISPGHGQQGGSRARGRGPEKDYLEKMKFLFYKKLVLKVAAS